MQDTSSEIAGKKKRRFARWRKTLPKRPRYLADLVAERIVPAFEERGFLWHQKATAGFVYLYQRDHACWPAVQLRFHPRRKPALYIDVACLPKTCRRWDGKAFVPVPRETADIVDGPVRFYLRNPRKSGYAWGFGYTWFSLWPQRLLRKDVDAIEAVLPRLFAVFEQGLLLEKSRWPEFEDLLQLADDRTTYFD